MSMTIRAVVIALAGAFLIAPIEAGAITIFEATGANTAAIQADRGCLSGSPRGSEQR